MLKKNIFKILCLILVLCAGVSFINFGTNNKLNTVSAEITDINDSHFNDYYNSIQDRSNIFFGTLDSEYCLRDDYVLYTQDQSAYGLCWSFSGNMALTTAIMMKTGEYYDFSEGWVSTVFNYLCEQPEYQSLKSALSLKIKNFDTYYVGGGALFYVGDYILRTAGAVLESDFNYTDFQLVCNENIEEVYNMYSQYSNEFVMNNVNSVKFNVYTQNRYSSNADTIKKAIKYHIKNNGAVSANMYWNSRYATNSVSTNLINGKEITYKTPNTYYSSSSNSAHAITLIGWEDDIVIQDTQGINHYGAWIALNSWGDGFGDNGVFYIPYDDTDFYGFYAYEYMENIKDTGTIGLNFSTQVSDSNATHKTSFKGAYYNNFSPITINNETQQKNIFYIDNMPVVNGDKNYNITYDYTISEGAYISDIKIYHYSKNVTNNFEYTTSSNQIPIHANNLEAGTYKVLIEYTNGTDTEEFLTCFYVMAGTEVNSITHFFDYTDRNNYSTTNESGIYNNGRFNLFNDYNYENNDLIFYSKNTTGTLTFNLQLSANSTVSSVTFGVSSVYAFVDDYVSDADMGFYVTAIYYNLNIYKNYPLIIKTLSGTTKTINVYILPAESTDEMINIIYDTNGGENNENNFKRVVISNNKFAKIYQPIAPTSEDGIYTFAGWYTDNLLTKPLLKVGSGNNEFWKLSYNSKMKISEPTIDVGCMDTFIYYLHHISYAHLYAKWEFTAKPTEKFYVTFVYNNGSNNKIEEYEYGKLITEPTNITKAGHKFIGWYTTKNFEENSIWTFNTRVTEDITLYAKWEINRYNVYIYYYDEVNPNEIYTLENENAIEYNTKITRPSITKTGYTLNRFYYLDNLEKKSWDFSTNRITQDIKIYAEWKFNDVQNLVLQASTYETETYTNFVITLTFAHELDFTETSASPYIFNIVVCENNEEILLDFSIEYNLIGGLYYYTITATNRIEIAGSYSYYVKINVVDEIGTILDNESNIISINAKEKELGITNINYTNKQNITWEDNDTTAGYIVYLYKVTSTGDVEIYKREKSYSKSVNVWDSGIKTINGGAGIYYIQIEKYYGVEIMGSTRTNQFNVYEVSYNPILPVTNVIYENILVDGNTKLSQPISPLYNNYTFIGWYTNEDFETNNIWDFSTEVNSNMQLYANWEILDDINFEETEDINSVYTYGNQYVLTCVPSHVLTGNVSYSYAWYKNGSQEVLSNENKINIICVNDSGNYICSVKLTDEYGFTKQTIMPSISVNIEKAQTYINTANMKKVYTYTGQEQIINSGARLTRNDEKTIEIQYFNNTFIDVPENGKFYVTVYAPATDNYNDATIEVEIEINKAESQITAENYQVFTYCAKNIMPTYLLGDLNKDQQEVIIDYDKNLLNAGTYKDVKIVAKESNNFKSSYTTVTVVINPARINIYLKDTSSIWLFDIQKVDYKVTGDFFGQTINIEVICSPDKNKVGKYEIDANIIDNKNYIATVYKATYTVTASPYYIAGIVLIAIIIIIITILKNRKYAIEFNENGGSVVPYIETKHKSEIIIKTPYKEGYEFVGWYLDKALTIPFNKKLKRGKNIILHAKWKLTKQQEIAQQTDNIVYDIMKKLNMVQEEVGVEETTLEPIYEEVVETAKEKSKEEIMQEIMQRANTTAKPITSEEELDDILTKLNLEEFKPKKPKVKKKSEQEIKVEELIKNATKNLNTKASNEELKNIINNVINENF